MQPNKTNEYDHSVLLDMQRHRAMVAPLMALCRGQPADARLWEFEQAEFFKEFVKASHRAGLVVLAPTPYGLRHGGASRDRSLRTRDLLNVQQRGA